jgi:hypothetical protein
MRQDVPLSAINLNVFSAELSPAAVSLTASSADVTAGGDASFVISGVTDAFGNPRNADAATFEFQISGAANDATLTTPRVETGAAE